MEVIGNNKFYTLDESLDLIFGEKGTPDREDYERYAASERRKESNKQHSIRVPSAMYSNMQRRASSMGVSVSAYARQVFASALL